VDVFLAPSPASRSRLGLIVPKHGKRIVQRNLLKRRLREIGRRLVLPAASARGRAVDILIRARRRGYDAGFDELTQEVMDAVEALW
jgi:ribonuclease P protein component